MDAGLSIQSLSIALTPRKVRNTWVIHNPTAQDIVLRLHLQAGAYRFPGFGPEDARGAFNDLTARADGNPIALERRTRAYLNGQDITAFLKPTALR